MTNIRAIKTAGGRKIGDVYDVSAGSAAYLIEAGYAEAAESPESGPKRGRPRKNVDEIGSDQG